MHPTTNPNPTPAPGEHLHCMHWDDVESKCCTCGKINICGHRGFALDGVPGCYRKAGHDGDHAYQCGNSRQDETPATDLTIDRDALRDVLITYWELHHGNDVSAMYLHRLGRLFVAIEKLSSQLGYQHGR